MRSKFKSLNILCSPFLNSTNFADLRIRRLKHCEMFGQGEKTLFRRAQTKSALAGFFGDIIETKEKEEEQKEQQMKRGRRRQERWQYNGNNKTLSTPISVLPGIFHQASGISPSFLRWKKRREEWMWTSVSFFIMAEKTKEKGKITASGSSGNRLALERGDSGLELRPLQ